MFLFVKFDLLTIIMLLNICCLLLQCTCLKVLITSWNLAKVWNLKIIYCVLKLYKLLVQTPVKYWLISLDYIKSFINLSPYFNLIIINSLNSIHSFFLSIHLNTICLGILEDIFIINGAMKTKSAYITAKYSLILNFIYNSSCFLVIYYFSRKPNTAFVLEDISLFVTFLHINGTL